MNKSHHRIQKARVALSVFLVFGIIVMNWGCTHSLTTRRLPDDTAIANQSSEDVQEQAQGIVYFLPSGRLHLVATLVTNFTTTNYQIVSETAANGAIVNDFLTVTKITTNTVSTTTSNITLATAKDRREKELSPGLMASNVSSVLSNVLAADGKAVQVVATNQTVTTVSSNLTPTIYPELVKTTNTVETTVTTEQPMLVTNYYYNITMSVEYVPDKANAFLINPHRSVWSDDNVNLTVNNGLLSSVTTTNTDQTGAVIQAVAQAAGQVFTLAAGGLPISTSSLNGPQVGSPQYVTDQTTRGVGKFSLLGGNIDAVPVATRIDAVNLRLNLGFSQVDLAPIQSDLRTWRSAENDRKDAEFEISALRTFTPKLSLQEVQAAYEKLRERIKTDDGAQANAENALQNKLATMFSHFIESGRTPSVDAMNRSGILFRQITTGLYQRLLANNQSTSLPLLRRLILEDAFPNAITPYPHDLKTQKLPEYLDISFDPSSTDEVDAAKASLIDAGLYLSGTEQIIGERNKFQNFNDAATNNIGGIYYRPALPYSISLSDFNSNRVTRTFLFPNTAPILNVDFQKAPFVTTVNQITMTNGFIASYGMNKPSTALAVAGLPSAIISSFVGGVTNIIQLRFNIATGQNAQSAAALTNQSLQLQSLSNTLAILNAQQQLYQAIANSKTNIGH